MDQPEENPGLTPEMEATIILKGQVALHRLLAAGMTLEDMATAAEGLAEMPKDEAGKIEAAKAHYGEAKFEVMVMRYDLKTVLQNWTTEHAQKNTGQLLTHFRQWVPDLDELSVYGLVFMAFQRGERLESQ